MNEDPTKKQYKMLYPNQILSDSLKMLDREFFTLRETFPNAVLKNKQYIQFFQSSYVFRDPLHKPLVFPSQSKKFQDVLDQNIQYLIVSGKFNYVQVAGHQIKDHCLNVKALSMTRAVISNSPLTKLEQVLPIEDLVDLVFNCTVIILYKGQYIQVLGIPLNQHFGFKIIGEKRKKVEQHKWLDYSVQIINRRQIFYCTHLGRDAGIFRKNVFFLKGMKPSSDQQSEIKVIVTRQIDLMFGIGKQKDCIRKCQKEILEKIMTALIRKFRDLFFIHSTKNSNKLVSEFNSLLIKICPLPKNYKIFKKSIEDYDQLTKQDITKLFNSMYQQFTPYETILKLLEKIMGYIPIQLFGKENTEVIIKSLNDFVKMKRFENIKIEDILTKMDVFKVQWMEQKFNKAFKTMIITRKRKVLALLICFIFNKILIPIVKYNFYVTEKHKEANKIFYYRKPLWCLISKLVLSKFSEENIEEITKYQYTDIKTKNYPEGKLRIMPKKDSFRPIITFNRKLKSSAKYNYNLNQILGDTQLVLRNLKHILGKEFGYCIFDNYQIFEKYDSFLKKWRKNGSPQLSFFTLDIKKCYDSISTQKLNQIIKTTPLIQHCYFITRYLKIYRNKKPLTFKKSMPYYFNVRQRSVAIPLSQDLIELKQNKYPPSIYIFLPKSRIITRATILAHISHLCQKSIISYEKRAWTQKFGIPQGLNVSGVLCSLYFAELERKFVKLKDGLLMRLTDDYMFIGSQNEARDVLNSLLQCSNQHRFVFNEEKIQGNFIHPIIKNIYKQRKFIWIGKQIDITNLQVYPHTESDLKKLSYAMNVNIVKKSAKNFLKNKLKSLLTNQFSAYFKPLIYNFQNIQMNLRIFCRLSLHKFFPFIQRFLELKDPNQDMILGRILQTSLHEFIIYTCFLFQKIELITNQLYHQMIAIALEQFIGFFKSKRVLNIATYRKMQAMFRNRLKKTNRCLASYETKKMIGN